MSYVIRVAEEKDLLPIQHLVAKAGISEAGIEHHVKDFLVVENEEKKIIGTVGIEKLGEDGMLRSLVIQAESWNAKLGLEFVELAIAYAKEQDINTLYLLTKRSIPLFEYLGFAEVTEADIPIRVRESNHFQQYEPGITKVLACAI